MDNKKMPAPDPAELLSAEAIKWLRSREIIIHRGGRLKPLFSERFMFGSDRFILSKRNGKMRYGIPKGFTVQEVYDWIETEKQRLIREEEIAERKRVLAQIEWDSKADERALQAIEFEKNEKKRLERNEKARLKRAEKRAAMPPKVKIDYWAHSTLISRGWTEKMVKDNLGDPDKFVKNPHYASASPMKLYAQLRVLEAESKLASPLVFNKIKRSA